MVIKRKLYTVTEFEALMALPEYAEPRLELIHGEIISGNLYFALRAPYPSRRTV